jgi:hypothetical protein
MVTMSMASTNGADAFIREAAQPIHFDVVTELAALMNSPTTPALSMNEEDANVPTGDDRIAHGSGYTFGLALAIPLWVTVCGLMYKFLI